MKKHFVIFYSPGTFMAEQTTKPIEAWDIDAAVAMSATIEERHGATPYGFRFTTRARAEDELDSKEIGRSSMYYLQGKIRTYDEVVADNLEDEETLRWNMKTNGFDRIWQSTKGWKWTQPLRPDDVVLDA